MTSAEGADAGAKAVIDARVAALPRLQRQAGAAYTLYLVATKAIQGAFGDAAAVNWAQVHQDVFAKAVGQDKQPVAQVLEAIKLHSPGAVTPEQIEAVQAMGEPINIPEMDQQSLKRAIHALADMEEDEFHVVCQNTSRPQHLLRPILLIVHPGDAIERASDWSDGATGTKVAALSMSNQSGMADEIVEKMATHDVIVLHRLSSVYLDQSGVHENYRDAVKQCEAVGLVLFGDDLPAAAKWMLESVDGLQMEGGQVFMTGAYADAEYGCITAVGKALLKANPELRIEVSDHAPTDNGDSVPRWRPLPGGSDRKRDHEATPSGP